MHASVVARTILRGACLACLLAAPPAEAQSAAAVRFAKLYSTLDGRWQAVELDIDLASGAPLVLGGRQLVIRDTRGNRRVQVLPSTWDGPVKRRKLLMASQTWDGWGFEYGVAELLLEYHALPIDGGTLELEGMDTWTFGPLPVDGRHALARDGTAVVALLDRYVRGAMENDTLVSWDRATAVAREYYHAGMDHYFVTAHMVEQDLLDGGHLGWAPTGFLLKVLTRPHFDDAPEAALPVCRFLLTYDGGYTHLQSSDPGECATIASSGQATLEASAAFLTVAPDTKTGACPNAFWIDQISATGELFRNGGGPPMIAVYRLWNGKAAANHRLVAGKTTRDAMVAQGWIAEGFGRDGVALCTNGAIPFNG